VPLTILDPKTRSRLELSQTQFDFASSPAFATLMAGGWGSGKSTAGLAFMLISAYANPPGTTGMAVQPTYQLLNEWLDTQFLPSFAGLIRVHNIGKRYVVLRGNRKILYRSGHEPKRLQLSNLSWLYLDEPHLMKREVFLNAIARARDVRSRLRIGLTSLPKIGWLSDEFLARDDEERRILHARTEENLHLHPDYARNLRSACPARMQACYLEGQFVPAGGTVYPEFEEKTHLIDWKYSPSVKLRTGQLVDTTLSVAIDWSPRRPHVLFIQHIPIGAVMPGGWVTEKPTSIVVDEILPDGEYQAITVQRLCKEILSRENPLSGQTYRVNDAVVDPAGKAVEATSGVSEIIQAEKYLGIPIHFRTGERIKVGVTHTKMLLEPVDGRPQLYFARTLKTKPYDPRGARRSRHIVHAVQGYSYPDKDSMAPDEPYDDDITTHAVDCLRYFVRFYHPVDNLAVKYWSAA